MSEEALEPEVVDPSTATEIAKLEQWTKSVIVQTPDQRSMVYEAIQGVKSTKARVVAFFKDSKESAHATWKKIVANEKSFTDRLDAFEAAGKRAIIAYDQVEEQKRQAEQRRLQAIADEAARKEREKAEQEAARQRQIEEEARAKAESARKAAESANAEERARLLREAAPRQQGEATRSIWKCRVVDVAAIPREYMVPNEKALDGIAKATKGAIKIAGVEFYEEKSLSVR
jgi:hypothetical protein